MDIQGVVPLPIEDFVFLVYKYPKFWTKNRRIEREITNTGDEQWPRILILMAWYVRKPNDGVKDVEKCLESIFNDGYPNEEIRIVVIVNGENPPCKCNIASAKQDIVGQNRGALRKIINNRNWRNIVITTVRCNKGNKAIPLNAGYEVASKLFRHPRFRDMGYILTIDPDGEIQPRTDNFHGSLKRLIAHFLLDEREEIGGVGGVITTRKEKKDTNDENEDEKYRCYNRYTKWEFLVSEYSTRWLRCVYHPYLYHISGGISAFRRNVLDEIKNKRKKIKAVVNGRYIKIGQIFNADSVTEDYEITQHILDIGRKVEHDPYATYYGGAENNHKSQWNRFRRWYGGATQVDKYRKNLFCHSSFWSKLSRGLRSFSTRKYTYWWIFTLVFFPIALSIGWIFNIDFLKINLLIFPEKGWRNLLDYTFFGTILPFLHGFSFETIRELLSFWLSFPKIYIAEVTLGWFELLFSTIFGFRSLNKKFGDFDKAWIYLGWCFWLPFEIVFWNRIYWFFFSIHGRVTKRKLPW